MNEIGDRIYVKDLLFEGYAIIQHILPRELFGIQVELEHGDEEGHRIFRVSKEQIIDTTATPPEQAEIGISVVKTVNLKVGDYYILRPQRGKVVTHYYVYRPHDEKLLGGYEVTCFKDIQPYHGKLPEPQLEKPKENKPMKFEQLSLF